MSNYFCAVYCYTSLCPPMDNMTNVLLVSYLFPPSGGVGIPRAIQLPALPSEEQLPCVRSYCPEVGCTGVRP
jgi:hypothetical protein